ncbi:Regulatory protein BlaR1 [Pseudoalteromonas sp. P1-9]|uniref:M56 family metallopeptidase n=1 Tax=Pseudoalteromonas sp. P1-9 TaxID=1710354 RepID=UPI0006D631A5|nr:M56 family metallopeptidase [Pseudoalteromonas sp. P1-9]KPV94115.1 Regulatory protein BlaR1 [Pseudoalteromonas sp. P1-9]
MDILPSLLESNTLYFISLTLLHFLWQGLVIAGLLFCVNKLTSNKHSQFRYIFSLFCLLLCVIAPTVTFYVLSQPDEIINVSTFTTNDVIASPIAPSGMPNTAHQIQLADYTPLVAVLWMTGIIVLSMRLTLQMLQVHRLTTTNIVQPSDKLELIFNQLKERLFVTKRARLVISLTAHVPMAIGWIKPVVLLPANLASGLSIAQLEMLMAHELAHIKRYDYLVNLIQTFVELVLFFHPAVKWISKQIRQEREYCCDDLAIHHCGNQLVYARALAEAEVLRHNIPELAMAATGGDLSSRIHRAVGQHSCAPRYGNQWLAALAAAFVIPSIFTASKVIAMTQTEPAPVLPTNQQHVMVLDAKVAENKKPQQPIIQKNKEQQASEPLETTVAKVEENVIEKASIKSTVVAKSTNKIHTQIEKTVSDTKPAPKLTSKESSLSKTRDTDKSSVTEVNEKETTKQQTIVSKQAKSAVIDKAQTANTIESTEVKPQQISKRKSNQLAAKANPLVETPSVATTELLEKLTTAPVVKNQPEKTKAAVEPKFTSAKLIHSVIPEYPRLFSSRQGNIDVSVTFTVNTNGRISEITYNGDVSTRFQRSITRALKEWRFEPAMQGDKEVETKISKIFSFSEPSQYLRPVTGSRIATRLR